MQRMQMPHMVFTCARRMYTVVPVVTGSLEQLVLCRDRLATGTEKTGREIESSNCKHPNHLLTEKPGTVGQL